MTIWWKHLNSGMILHTSAIKRDGKGRQSRHTLHEKLQQITTNIMDYAAHSCNAGGNLLKHRIVHKTIWK